LDEAELKAILRAIVIKNAGLPVREIGDEQVLAGTGFDSLAFVQTQADLEAQLGVWIPPERAEELRDLTFREFVALVREERGGK
jgi:acyl carrier protein